MNPTPRQQEAIESWNRGDVCVVAGPGSGKTFVLVERFKWLVQAKGVPVRRILAITFTEKAAANMRRRLVEAFQPASAERKAVERAYISTIHAFCARLLRENAIEAAVDPEFGVLDEWEADFDLRRAIEEALEGEYAARPEHVRKFLSRFGSNDVHGSLFGLYQALRAAGVGVSEAAQTRRAPDARERWGALLDAYARLASLRAVSWSVRQRECLEQALAPRERLTELAEREAGPEHFRALREIGFNLNDFKRGSPQLEILRAIRDELAPACRAALLLEQNQPGRQWFLDVLAEADQLYRTRKQARAALDFSDLEECAIRLLEKAGARLRGHFSHILMDEFQDTNPLQARLVGLLRSRDNFFAVGDINQSIYGFRHADPTVFRDFRERTEKSGGHVAPLLENFRSRPEVLAAAKKIIAGAEGVEAQDLEAVRDFPPRAAPFVEILTVQAGDGEEALKLEAYQVAARVRHLCGRLALRTGPARYGDMAVLLRTSAQVRVFERALREQGVPCEVTEGRGYYDTREVNDVICFLRVLLNPLDEISLAAVLRSPLAGVSDETLLRLKLAHPSLITGLERASGPELEQIRLLLERYRRDRDYTPLDRLLSRLLAETGYEAWLLEQPAGAHMAANVRKLVALARRFHASGLTGLQSFIERVEDLRREGVREAEAQPPEQTHDAVQLMTVHAAKGLEFPVVFLPAINRRPRSEPEAVSFLPGIGVGFRWRNPATGEMERDAVAEEIAEEARASRREESQRLFYVAMTRAEEHLVLSASFGRQVRVEQWAGNLERNLGVDFRRVDEEEREVEMGGCLVRLVQTGGTWIPAGPLGPAALPVERPAEVHVLPADEQSDTAVSATSVALFAQCPRRYYLSRYLGFEDRPHQAPPGEDFTPAEPDEMDPTEFGRHVHGLLAGAIPRENGDAEALRLVARFEASAWGRRAASAGRLEREQSFLCSLGGRLVSGQIDLWFRDGETVLIDYKTDDVKAPEAAARAAEYELQLRLYALALERLTGSAPDSAILYFLRPNAPVNVSLDPGELEAAQSKVEELFQAQSRLAFPLRVGEHCFRCPHFRGICPARFPAAGSTAVE